MTTTKRRLWLLTLMLTVALIGVQAQWQRVTNLPAIYIETDGGRTITSKTTYIGCTLRYVDEQDEVTTYEDTEIRGRGNSTWNLAKKPYRIKFAEKQKILGKGYAKAKKWTLLANAADKTLIRNAVTSAMGEFTSLRFNPAYKFVDMFMNGQYMGNYQLSDQVEVRPHRVDIAEQDLPLTDDSNITGGYLLEVDGFKDGNCFTTGRYSVPIRIHYPDDEDIAPSQDTYIRNYIAQFETLLKSNRFADAEDGYRPMVDEASLIDWFLCTEISANLDGYYSTYFYKEQDDPRLYWGPLWDYDIAYNNDYRVQYEKGLSSTVDKLMTDVGYGQTKQWLKRMWEDPWFAERVNARYNELLENGLVDYLNHTIDSLVTLLDASQQRNYELWGINRRMYHEVVLYSSYDQYISDLRTFIVRHCEFLKGAFANKTPEEPTPKFTLQNSFYRIVNSQSAKALEADDAQLWQYDNLPDKMSEEWWIKPEGEHYMLLNRESLKALNDPTEGQVGALTNVGTRLNVATEDPTDERQLWDFEPQGTQGWYNLINVYTQHAMNLSGGSRENGAGIISYINDSRNGESKNRLWFIMPTGEEIPEELTGITDREPDDYALAYDPVTKELHFGCAVPSQLERFSARVLTVGGQPVGTFRADSRFSMMSQPDGVYIVVWQCGGRQRSVKFRK